jgi:hypothetical protein
LLEGTGAPRRLLRMERTHELRRSTNQVFAWAALWGRGKRTRRLDDDQQM